MLGCYCWSSSFSLSWLWNAFACERSLTIMGVFPLLGERGRVRASLGFGGLFAGECELIKDSDAICFGPNTDRARAGNRTVLDLNERFAIERHDEFFSFEVHAQGVPLVGSNSRFDGFE